MRSVLADMFTVCCVTKTLTNENVQIGRACCLLWIRKISSEFDGGTKQARSHLREQEHQRCPWWRSSDAQKLRTRCPNPNHRDRWHGFNDNIFQDHKTTAATADVATANETARSPTGSMFMIIILYTCIWTFRLHWYISKYGLCYMLSIREDHFFMEGYITSKILLYSNLHYYPK